GSESAPPCKTPLICCADGLDEDTFKICKELFRPFKKSLKKLQSPQHLPREKQLKYMKESLTIIGDRIDTFLQQYCRASEVKHWQKMFWQFISLFSKMDGKQLQKLYKYIKNNQIDKFVVIFAFSSRGSKTISFIFKALKRYSNKEEIKSIVKKTKQQTPNTNSGCWHETPEINWEVLKKQLAAPGSRR
uniref:Chromosome 17 open reading frame 64 n=1 Tax=Athene cunicularia TaxID=194338 RepID=A0A663MBE4_ATHCN